MNHLIDDSLAAWMRASDYWMRFSRGVARDALEANRASAAALGLTATTEAAEAATSPALPSVDYRNADWHVERSVDAAADIGVGDYVTFSKHLTDDDVRSFARASGDTNRLHLDRAFAERSRFGERIVHGTLVSGLISAALARLPGLTIYLTQDVEYLGPVRIDERATARCEVVEELGRDRYRLLTVVTDEDGETVVDGEAVVLIDELPTDEGAHTGQ